jgi:membrane dipeptidase
MKKLYLLLPFFTIVFANAQNKFHFKSIVIDTHNDVLSSATLKGLHIEDNLSGKAHSDIARWQQGGVDIQIFSIFCDERQGKGQAFNYALREIDSLDNIVARNPTKMMLVTDKKELKQAIKRKLLGCMKGVEGGHMIEDDLQLLDSLYKRGVRYITLTWNNSTSWASSAKDETLNTLPQGQQKGLNAFGKQVVQRMNDLNMLVDVSHIGEQTFWDVMATTTKPVIASHSCARALCNHRRNLTDDQIKAIGKNGGVIHLNFYSGFLDGEYEKRKNIFLNNHKAEVDSCTAAKMVDYEIAEFISKKYPAEAFELRPSLDVLLNHVDHIVKLIGINHVGLGSDFDGIESMPKELNGVEDFPKITEALLKRGYTKKEVRKILGENFLRVFM